MKKSALILAAVLLFAFSLPSLAGDLEEAVPDRVRDRVGTSSAPGGVSEILRNALDDSLGEIRQLGARALGIFAAALLTGTASVLAGEKGVGAVRLCGTAAITALSASGVGSMLSMAGELSEQISAFAAVLLPTVASACVGAGQAASSAASLAATTLVLDLLADISARVTRPLVYCFAAASAGAAAFGGYTRSLASLIKWAAATVLTLTAMLFTAYLGITGAVSGGADAAAVKLTKTAISGLVPVVGKIVSDAADSVASGFVILRNTAGIFGMLVILALIAGPALEAAAGYLFFKAAAILSEGVAGQEISALIGDMGTAMALALGSAGLSGVIVFISVTNAILRVSS